ncbi:MAG: peptidylprolyl isomerase, partial [Alphaproteobacteria bacterium]
EAAIAAEMQHHPAPDAETAWREAAHALVVRRLLLTEAAARGLWRGEADAAGPAAEAAIERLLQAAIVVPTADEEACRLYHRRNPARFRTPDLYEAEHILLAAAPDDDDARAQARRRASALIALLSAAPERFAEHARRWSACPSRDQGGHLGQFAAGTTVPELETFLAALEEGQLCPVPVDTRYGVHVLRLLRRSAGRSLPFEAVRDRIGEMLAAHAWGMAVRQYLMQLAARADVRGVALARASGPLVQ